MASTNFKNFLIEKIKQRDSEIDLQEGSNFRDILVNPLAVIFEDYQNEHKRILDNLSLKNPAALQEDELDAIGSRYLVSRKEGSYATGKVQVYYIEPIPISIPAGTRFENENIGVEYETISSYDATRSTLQQNQKGGLFHTDPINVRTVEKSTAGNLNSGARLSSVSLIKPSPEKIVVETDITGGQPREDNQTYYRRIQNSVRNATLASKQVIRDNVIAQNSSVQYVEVVGAGDPLMNRDLVQKDELSPFTIENYEFVDEGQPDNGYYRGHKAYLNKFSFDVAVQSGSQDVVWPSAPTAWTNEFDSDQYKGIYKKSDALSADTDQYKILNIPSFTNSLFNEFEFNDGVKSSGELVWPSEIRLEGSTAVLGRTPQGDLDVRISREELEQLEVDLTDGIDQKEFEIINGALKKVKEQQDPEVFANLAPVFHKDLSQHVGISIETTMSTTDKSDTGKMAYITVLRNDEIYLPHDGYGLGWRKQPQFLLRLNDNTYTDPEQKEEDIATFEDYFGVNPETAGVVGNLSDPANDQYWFYNVYLVDNDILQEEVNLGYNKILDQSSGRNQYLQSSKHWIEPDTDYDFKIQVTETLGTKIWVRPSGGTYELKIDRGATFPQYVPNAGEKITSENSQVQQLDSTKGHFGIGVGETKSYEWSVKSLTIDSIMQNFPMQLFRFKVDTTKWPSSSSAFDVDYYGVGYDPDLYATDGTGHSRTQMAIWNPGTTSWETLDTHTAEISDGMESRKLEGSLTSLSTYMDVDDYIHIAASAANFGTGFENDSNHNLKSYYIELRNPQADMKHLFNAIDVYCHAPESVSRKISSALTVTNNQVIFTEPYIQDIIEVREASSDITFDENQYEIFNNEIGEEFSKDNNIKIAFDPSYEGTQIEIIYRSWNSGDLVNAYLNSPQNRYPGVTIKEKVMPPAVVKINRLDYSGGVEEPVMINTVKDYLNSITDGKLEKSDLINVLYDNGATFVDLDMDITIKQYYTNFRSLETELTGQRYEIPTDTKSRFYADNITLSGVTNV